MSLPCRSMRQRTLGRTGVHVSPLCLGAMMFGAWGETDHDASIRIIHRALDAGQLHRHRRRLTRCRRRQLAPMRSCHAEAQIGASRLAVLPREVVSAWNAAVATPIKIRIHYQDEYRHREHHREARAAGRRCLLHRRSYTKCRAWSGTLWRVNTPRPMPGQQARSDPDPHADRDIAGVVNAGVHARIGNGSCQWHQGRRQHRQLGAGAGDKRECCRAMTGGK
jgi:hypothetical protein